MATLALVDLILKFAHGGSRWMQRLSVDPLRVAGVVAVAETLVFAITASPVLSGSVGGS